MVYRGTPYHKERRCVMQSTFDGNNIFAIGVVAFPYLAVVWGLFVMIFWMVCGWRAMRAHERLANSVEQMSRKQG